MALVGQIKEVGREVLYIILPIINQIQAKLYVVLMAVAELMWICW